MSVFKFPGDGNVVFQCQISLCDMESDDACKTMIVSSILKISLQILKDKIISYIVFHIENYRYAYINPCITFYNCFVWYKFSLKPPRCSHNSTLRLEREARDKIKPGFAMTFSVETRTLNVLENESIRPATSIKYCDIRV